MTMTITGQTDAAADAAAENVTAAEPLGYTEPTKHVTIINAADYQRFARGGVHDHAEPHAQFYTMGILGEGGEVVDKLKKGVRHDYELTDIPDDIRRAIMLELGDTLWYTTNLCGEMSAALQNVMAVAVSGTPRDSVTLDLFQQRVVEQWAHVLNKPIEAALPRLALKMGARQGRLSEYVDAYLDGDYTHSDILVSVAEMLKFITMFAHLLGFTIKDVMQMNVDKLIDRRTRGASRGDGDNR